MSREFQKGDCVREVGTRLKYVIVDIETRVDRIKIRALEGENKGKESWEDYADYTFWEYGE